LIDPAMTRAGQPVHLRRVGKLLFQRRRRARLGELAEARSRVGETPRRHLNAKTIQRRPDLVRCFRAVPCTVHPHGQPLKFLSTREIYSLLKPFRELDARLFRRRFTVERVDLPRHRAAPKNRNVPNAVAIRPE
jgi:hypothetical protein